MGLSNQLGGVLGAAVSGALLASTGYEGIGYLCLGVTIASALLTGSSEGSSARTPGESQLVQRIGSFLPCFDTPRLPVHHWP